MVLVGAAIDFPVGIERLHLFEPAGQHLGAGVFPIRRHRNVEDGQVFIRGCRQDGMRATVRELEVVLRTGEAEHDAIESLVILEAADNLQTKALAVHGSGPCQIADWPCDSKVMQHGHGAGFLLPRVNKADQVI
jgi:hypothetical protein